MYNIHTSNGWPFSKTLDFGMGVHTLSRTEQKEAPRTDCKEVVVRKPSLNLTSSFLFLVALAACRNWVVVLMLSKKASVPAHPRRLRRSPKSHTHHSQACLLT